MEPQIRERFNENIFGEALARYGIFPENIQPLDGFESFIYEFNRDDGDYILRIGHSARRSEAMIHGEVDWINYLADGGASVARAIHSARGRLVEALDDGEGEHFLATAFVKAPGGPPGGTSHSGAFYETYGQLLGRMHALSKRYRPVDPRAFRPQWDDPVMLEAEQHLSASESLAVERFRRVVDHLHTLPQSNDDYGLTHFDAHQGNMFVDEEGTITLFDFDDCHYQWYANDIAIVLFYNVMDAEDKAAFTQEFLARFLRGYSRENRLNPLWLREIPWFLKLREIDLYSIIHRSFDVDNLDDPWVARYMEGRKEKIERDVPYLDVDFDAFAACLAEPST